MTMKTEILPRPVKTLLNRYFSLVDELEQLIAAKCSTSSNNCLHCRPGCAECCIPFSIQPLEAAIVAHHLIDNDGAPLSSDPSRCPMLSNDRCHIYAVRPVICRTQGLAIGYLDAEEGTLQVSCCPLNFPEDYDFSEEEILLLDEYNTRLAQLNQEYCRKAGINPLKRVETATVALLAAQREK